ncbi:hypothetical protein GLU64_02225 [Nanohaloarchaea archaeon]|nr:hypothetical protein [Candidatus Nanohaloarchaea archaeon]
MELEFIAESVLEEDESVGKDSAFYRNQNDFGSMMGTSEDHLEAQVQWGTKYQVSVYDEDPSDGKSSLVMSVQSTSEDTDVALNHLDVSDEYAGELKEHLVENLSDLKEKSDDLRRGTYDPSREGEFRDGYQGSEANVDRVKLPNRDIELKYHGDVSTPEPIFDVLVAAIQTCENLFDTGEWEDYNEGNREPPFAVDIEPVYPEDATY